MRSGPGPTLRSAPPQFRAPRSRLTDHAWSKGKIERLFHTARSDATPPFSLVLCGDNELMPRLNLVINQALLSRLCFCIRLDRWNPEALKQYLGERLAEVGIHNSPFEAAADALLLQSAYGTPRTLNALQQRSMEQAAFANCRTITAVDVQAALNALPLVARPRPES